MSSKNRTQSHPASGSGLKVKRKMRAAAARTFEALCCGSAERRSRKFPPKEPARHQDASTQVEHVQRQVSMRYTAVKDAQVSLLSSKGNLQQSTQTLNASWPGTYTKSSCSKRNAEPGYHEGSFVFTTGSQAREFQNPLFQTEPKLSLVADLRPATGSIKSMRRGSDVNSLDDHTGMRHALQDDLMSGLRRSQSVTGTQLQRSSLQLQGGFPKQQELLDQKKQKKMIAELRASEASLQSQASTLQAQVSGMASRHDELEVHDTSFRWCLEQFQAKSAALVKEKNMLQLRLEAATSPQARTALRAEIRAEEEARAVAHQVAVRAVAAACAREEARRAAEQAAVPVDNAQVSALRAQVSKMSSYIKQLEARETGFGWCLQRSQAQYAAMKKGRDALHRRLQAATSPEMVAVWRAEIRAEEEARAVAHQVAVSAMAAACAREETRLAALAVQQEPFQIANPGSSSMVSARCKTPTRYGSLASAVSQQGGFHLSIWLMERVGNGMTPNGPINFDFRSMLVRCLSGQVFVSIVSTSARAVAWAGQIQQLLWLSELHFYGPRAVFSEFSDATMQMPANKSTLTSLQPLEVACSASLSHSIGSGSITGMPHASALIPGSIFALPTMRDVMHMCMMLGQPHMLPFPVQRSSFSQHERDSTLTTHSRSMCTVVPQPSTRLAAVHPSRMLQHQRNAIMAAIQDIERMMQPQTYTQLAVLQRSFFFSQSEQDATLHTSPTFMCTAPPQPCTHPPPSHQFIFSQQRQNATLTIVASLVCTVLLPARTVRIDSQPSLASPTPPLMQMLPHPSGHSLFDAFSHTLPQPLLEEPTSHHRHHGLPSATPLPLALTTSRQTSRRPGRCHHEDSSLPVSLPLVITFARQTGRGHGLHSLLGQLSTARDRMTADGPVTALTVLELLHWFCQKCCLGHEIFTLMPNARIAQGACIDRLSITKRFKFCIYTESILWVSATQATSVCTLSSPVASSLMSHVAAPQAVDTAQLSMIQSFEVESRETEGPHTDDRGLVAFQDEDDTGKPLSGPCRNDVLGFMAAHPSSTELSPSGSVGADAAASVGSDVLEAPEVQNQELLDIVVNPTKHEVQTTTEMVALAVEPILPNAQAVCSPASTKVITDVLEPNLKDPTPPGVLSPNDVPGPSGQAVNRGCDDAALAGAALTGMATASDLSPQLIAIAGSDQLQSSTGTLALAAASALAGDHVVRSPATPQQKNSKVVQGLHWKWRRVVTALLKEDEGTSDRTDAMRAQSEQGLGQWGDDESAGSSVVQGNQADADQGPAAATEAPKQKKGSRPSVRGNRGVRSLGLWGGDDSAGSSLSLCNAADADQGSAAATGKLRHRTGASPSVRGNRGLPRVEWADATANATLIDGSQTAAQAANNIPVGQPHSPRRKQGGRQTRGGRNAKGGKVKAEDLSFMHQTTRPFSLSKAMVRTLVANNSSEEVQDAMRDTPEYRQGQQAEYARREAVKQQKEAAQQAMDSGLAQQAPAPPRTKGRGGLAEFKSSSYITAWPEDQPFDDNESEEMPAGAAPSLQPAGPPPGLQRSSAKGSSRCTRVAKWGHDGYERLSHGRNRS